MAFTVTGVDPQQNPALASIEKRTGPSNFYRLLAHHPSAMEDVARLYQTVMGPGSLDLRLKTMVYLAVSAVNEAAYCVSQQAADAQRAGLSDHDVEDLRAETNQNFSVREQAALHYAREMAREASAGNEVRDRLQRLFSADQIVELTLVVALANFTNRISNGLAIAAEKTDKHRTA